jgi:fibronectin type 3 domain-containing protein
MNTMRRLPQFLRLRRPLFTVALLVVALALVSVASADVPNRVGVRGTVPDPGTQQQELANITFPAPYNVFEFVVTCMACHGGTVDQQAGHGGNWAGTSMASAARDPVFRANQMIVNSQVASQTGKDGAGNLCFRCHSPNGWYSGRFDPTLNGAADGSSMIHTILLSTDDEGIMCETCHRSLGSVTMKRQDLDPMDAVWNMLAGISDWPHAGGPYVDQVGDPAIAAGNPYGDGTLQIADGMTYGGRYPGYVWPYSDDIPLQPDPQGYMGYSPGGPYTGQTYGVYPPGWLDPQGNPVGGLPAFNPDGTLPIQLDIPIGPPLNPDGTPCYQCQSISLEHPTFGASYVETAEFCGSCHDQNLPFGNLGMPVQRTYTEWKYSALGQEGPDQRTCQSCHMPRLSHEYTDDAPVTLNVDPVVSGWFPYAKSRTNTAFHKLAGANRDLPMIMKALYPEVDFEVIGGGEGANGVWVSTGNDPRIFPGMLSTRNSMWDRNQRNTEITLQDGVDVQIASGPTYDPATGKWTLQVKVINNTGHRIPSGYPDGRRMWIQLQVKNSLGAVVYQSGHYDAATAKLVTAPGWPGLRRALSPQIDAANNAVMVYEKVTGRCQRDQFGNLARCRPSLNPLNNTVLFDNRIPPFGFTYADYRQAGVKFWNYTPGTYVPVEDPTRYPDGQNWDLVTYTFSAPANAVLTARAEVYWQTLTRDFVEHLRVDDASTVRPVGPVRVWAVNYPLDPNYLSDEFGLADVQAQMAADGWVDPVGNPITLNDNWGGIAYAAWYVTGKGAPFSVAVADSAAAAPGAPANVQVWPQCDPVTGVCVGGVINPDTGLLEPYTQRITWDPVLGAEGYLVWIKYGPGLTTASWDRLAIVQAPTTELINTSLNVDKTYIYKVQAFNGAGYGAESAEASGRTPWDLPLPPENLVFVSSTLTRISMSWYDTSDNEDGWIVRRLDVPADPGQIIYPEIARFPTANRGGFGGVPFTDGDWNPDVTWAPGYVPPAPGRCYNYVVEAYNTAGNSGWNVNGPVQMCTQGPPGAPAGLVATVVSGVQVDLAWTAATGIVDGYRVERSEDGGATWVPIVTGLTTTGYSDVSVAPNTTYDYRVFAYNTAGDSPPSNVATVTTPGAPPAAPSGLIATASLPSPDPPTVSLDWTDNAGDEDGFVVERAPDNAGVPGTYALVATIQAPDVTNYLDATVAPKMTYWYRVAAFNANGNSPYSNQASAVTPGQVPEAPANLRIVRRGLTSLSLAWADLSTNELAFNIERSPDGIDFVLVAVVPANTTIYTDAGLARQTTYYYRVQATNADGGSAYSNVVAGTTR